MHNASGLLDPALPQTSTRAEIEALSQALRIIKRSFSRNFLLQHFYIITDSSYLVQTFSELVQNWANNGRKNSKGKKVAHLEIVKDISERLDDMTFGDDGGLTFKFWRIPREENGEADALANEALGRQD